MDFEYTPKVKDMQARLLAFMDEHIYPNEARFFAEIAENRAKGNAWVPTQIVEELKPKALAAGLWNLFLPKSTRAPQGLSNLEYAPLCEIMGRVPSWKRWSVTPAKASRTNGWNRCCAVKFARPF